MFFFFLLSSLMLKINLFSLARFFYSSKFSLIKIISYNAAGVVSLIAAIVVRMSSAWLFGKSGRCRDSLKVTFTRWAACWAISRLSLVKVSCGALIRLALSLRTHSIIRTVGPSTRSYLNFSLLKCFIVEEVNTDIVC